ncbi:LAFA_0G10022g1_1 [Lachancea sp. 'fantastica']|nr:LAFA_0G10022g1_1 [Lachancea sp. 'fantastica']
MARRQDWKCWLITRSISEPEVLILVDELDRRGLTPSSTKSDEFPELQCWQIKVASSISGEAIIYTRSAGNDDNNSPKNRFEACLFSDNEKLGLLMRNWIAQHTESFVEKMEFQNPLMIAIADCILQQGLRGVRILYEPETQNRHLKKMEFDFAEPDVRALVQSHGNQENALSKCILPYLQSQTGIRCHILPLSEVRIQDRVIVTPEALGTLNGDGSVLKALASPLLGLFNAFYREAIAKNQ